MHSRELFKGLINRRFLNVDVIKTNMVVLNYKLNSEKVRGTWVAQRWNIKKPNA